MPVLRTASTRTGGEVSGIETFLSFRSGSHYWRTWRGWRLRGREPKQHTALGVI
jgi:hypothetical protein